MSPGLRPGVVTLVRYGIGSGDGADDGPAPDCGLPDGGLPAERVVVVNPPTGLPADDVSWRRRAGDEADGQYLAFVPGWARLAPGCLGELIATLERHPTIGAAAPGRPGGGGPDGRVLAAPPGVLVVRTAAWRRIGGFAAEAGDLADLDFGWRLNLAGYDVLVRADLVVFDLRPPSERSAIDPTRFRLVAERCFEHRFVEQVLPALRLPGAPGPVAWGPTGRAAVQALRVRSDAELRPLLAPLFEPAAPWHWDEAELVRTGGADLIAGRQRILVVTGDTLGERMAGPAIRAWEMASALADEHDVVLAAMGACALSSDRFRAQHVNTEELRELEAWCDVLVFQGYLLNVHPWIASSTKILVADMYDPIHLEVLEQDRARPAADRAASLANAVDTVNVQLRRADFFLCASQKQRDLWLGHLASLGRINPLTYDGDENLDALIAVAPFGTSPTPPTRTRPAIKGVEPGIGLDDKVVLWGGGIYNWFDPLTLLRAVDVVRRTLPSVRLYFLGVKHPNPAVPAMRMAGAAQELAAELGLLGTHAFFNADWVAYDDRQNYLLEADVGVSCHYSHVETAFSFRTRILDYLWASLPIVTTDGDAFGDLVEAEHLGVAVPPEDVDALAGALLEVLSDPGYAAECRARVAAVAKRFTWDRALAPLVEFCRAPHVARDRVAGPLPDPAAGLAKPPRDWRAEWGLVKGYYAAGGVRELGRRVRGRLTKNR